VDKFTNLKEFFDKEDKTNLKKLKLHSMNFRMPFEVNKEVEQTIENMKLRLGITMSKNDFILLCLVIMLDMDQDPSKKFYVSNRNMGFNSYIDSNEAELQLRVMKRMFSDTINKYVKD
jgi:hypothetical protein